MRFDGKRVFDVITAGVGLALGWPLLLGIAIAVRLDSRGPALFRQERVGMHGRVFQIHKFRTMGSDAGGVLVSPTNDPRVTRTGGLLRRSKLDEIPQLLDVVAGHMSLVGPRPEVPEYVSLWTPHERATILSVRPGITDPASIMLRHEAEELAAADDPERYYVESLLPRKATMYVEYVRNRTFSSDLHILMRTIFAVFTRRTTRPAV